MGADDESNADAPRVLRKGGPADVGIRCVHKFITSLAARAQRLRSAPIRLCTRVDTGRFTCLSAAIWRNKASQTCQAVGAGRQLTAIRPMLRPQPGAPLSPAYAAGVVVVCSLPVELRCAHARH
jgi:hypothetical protein